MAATALSAGGPPAEKKAVEASEHEDDDNDEDLAPPAALTAPQGLAGLFRGGSGAHGSGGVQQPLDVSKLSRASVLVHVYDVGDEELIKKVNRVTTVNNRVLIGGVYHAGVEVFGKEWGYGFTEDEGTGVCFVAPRCNPQHTYKATAVLGETALSEEDVERLLVRLASEWRGADYDFIHLNCCDFANALCLELGVGRIPGWVDRLGRTASKLDKFGRRTAQQWQRTTDLARTMSFDVAQAIRGLGGAGPLEADAGAPPPAPPGLTGALINVQRFAQSGVEALSSTDFGLTVRDFGREVDEVGRWTWGPAREAIGEGLRAWGRGLGEGQKLPRRKILGGPTKGASPQEQDLRAALRRRGGAYVRPTPAADGPGAAPARAATAPLPTAAQIPEAAPEASGAAGVDLGVAAQ